MYLKRGADMGNGVSMKTLFGCYENFDGNTTEFISHQLAYKYGKGAIMCGINVFKRVTILFNKNYKALYPIFA